MPDDQQNQNAHTIALTALTTISAHITECDKRDSRNERIFQQIRDGLADADRQSESRIATLTAKHEETQKEVNKIQVRIGMALGALLLLGKAIDLILSIKHP